MAVHHHGSWSLPATLVLALAAVGYLAAWRRRFAADWRRIALFEGGMLVLWVAMCSPLAFQDHYTLTAHMVQHLLIMTVAAPLLLWRSAILQPVRIGVHPVLCWLAGTGVVIWWHVPAIFQLGMESVAWHAVEQITFLIAGLLFWLPVIHGASQWSVPLYLFLATLPCDALSAFLTFCGHVVYRSYIADAGLGQVPALLDQACAGALMWVWVTFAYLFPAVVITLRILSPRMTASHLKVA